jgi:hypothetical protein
MARRKLNRNQRQKKRQDKTKNLKSICQEGIEIKVHESGLPITPEPQKEKVFTFPENPDPFIENLKKRFLELFGDDEI